MDPTHVSRSDVQARAIASGFLAAPVSSPQKSRSFAPAALRMTRSLAPRKEREGSQPPMQGLAEPVRGTFPPFFLLFFPTNPRGAVILSERAARARAKDLLFRT